MAGVSQVRRAAGEFESRLVRVNGQPGRLVRSAGEERFGEAERIAGERALALLKAGDEQQLAAHMMELARRFRATRADQSDVRVRDVLTVDIVEGRIQTVRIVRNPDKLAHL
jgi:RNA polymerase sigma-70 factor (ECF subfamily)